MKLTELEAAARAATPSPWTAKRYGVIVGGVTRQYVNGSAQDQLVMVSALNHDNAGSQDANTAFITAMQPDAALKLIAVAQAAPAVIEAMAECLEIARQWEPDGSTGIERRWLVLGRDARNALRNAIAALERTE
ncbi:MAG: hypothetical protein V4669_13995 [Pseudomonadota bacterium]